VSDTDVSIDGIALDEKTVADFMVRLQNSGLFSNVVLKSVKRKQVEKSNLKSFQVVCTKVQPQQPKQQPSKKRKSRKVKA
jgi:type IV pilus assembly protein PilN